MSKKKRKHNEPIIRSSKCSLRFATAKKQATLVRFLTEHVRLVNLFIVRFWDTTPSKDDLTADVINVFDTWLSARSIKAAARQAVDMITATHERHKTAIEDAKQEGRKCKSTPKRPVLRKLKAQLCTDTAVVEESSDGCFDMWLHLHALGNKDNRLTFDIPISRHKHYNKLLEDKDSKRLNGIVLTDKYVQLSFQLPDGKKLPPTGVAAIDMGINALASVSTGEQYGTELRPHIERVLRCQHGSKGQRRARRALEHYIDVQVKSIMSIVGLTMLVIENLKRITFDTKQPKRRLGKNMRRIICTWKVGYFVERLLSACERNRVCYRKVAPYYTSRTCPVCGHCHKKNRNGELFNCLKCGHTDNADINASFNILARHLNGKYGNDCIPLPDKRKQTSLRPEKGTGRCNEANIPVAEANSPMVERSVSSTGSTVPVAKRKKKDKPTT